MNQAEREFAARSSPFAAFGLKPGGEARPAGLPATSNMLGDNGAVPWHPDSPLFWGGILLIAVLFGAVGLTAGVRGGPVTLTAKAGKT